MAGYSSEGSPPMTGLNLPTFGGKVHGGQVRTEPGQAGETRVETTHSLANLRATNGNNEYTLWPHPQSNRNENCTNRAISIRQCTGHCRSYL